MRNCCEHKFQPFVDVKETHMGMSSLRLYSIIASNQAVGDPLLSQLYSRQDFLLQFV